MHTLGSEFVREYLTATGWNSSNQYSDLVRDSSFLIDFTVPAPGLKLAWGHRATDQFASNVDLALPLHWSSAVSEQAQLAAALAAREAQQQQQQQLQQHQQQLAAAHRTTGAGTSADGSVGAHAPPPLPPPPPQASTAGYYYRDQHRLASQLTYLASSVALDSAPSSARKLAEEDPAHRHLDFKKATNAFEYNTASARHWPRRPELRPDVQPTWVNGQRVDKRDYLLYGKLYAPSPRLDALCITRLSPTVQALISVVSVPSPLSPSSLAWQPPPPPRLGSSENVHGAAPLASSTGAQGGGASSSGVAQTSTVSSGGGGWSSSAPAPGTRGSGASELEVRLQIDKGRWSSELSYSALENLLGAKALYNFGWRPSPFPSSSSSYSSEGGVVSSVVDALASTEEQQQQQQRASASPALTAGDDDAASSGSAFKGRWSAGGEVYFSAQERSAGLSTGLRFTTLPVVPPSSSPSDAAATAAAIALTGTSNAAVATADQAFSSTAAGDPPMTLTATLNPIMGHLSTAYAVQTTRDAAMCSRFDFNMYSYDANLTIGGEWYARRKRSAPSPSSPPAKEEKGKANKARVSLRDEIVTTEEAPTHPNTSTAATATGEGEVASVLKLRASTSSDVALLWEAHLGDVLVSLGASVNLARATGSQGRRNPLLGAGVGISYWG